MKKTAKRKPALTREQVYALRAYTVETKGKEFFFFPTYDASKKRGPYKSLQACTMAIQRLLQQEFMQRHQRIEALHGQHR